MRTCLFCDVCWERRSAVLGRSTGSSRSTAFDRFDLVSWAENNHFATSLVYFRHNRGLMTQIGKHKSQVVVCCCGEKQLCLRRNPGLSTSINSTLDNVQKHPLVFQGAIVHFHDKWRDGKSTKMLFFDVFLLRYSSFGRPKGSPSPSPALFPTALGVPTAVACRDPWHHESRPPPTCSVLVQYGVQVD